MMAFTWDWLLNNMISSGITDYYQLNVCINHCDFMLYRLGRDKGALLTEAHIIQRTSNNRYSITSYDFDTVTHKSCRNVSEVCSYIIKEFIPVEYRAVPPGEKLKFLRERRLKRMTAARATRYGHLSGECGFEFDGETEKSFRENMAAESDSKLERSGDFQITAKTKTVKNE